MNKNEAIQMLVDDKIELIGYVPRDEFSHYHYEDLRACFMLSISGQTWWPSNLESIYSIVIESKPFDEDGAKAKKSLIKYMDASHKRGYTFDR